MFDELLQMAMAFSGTRRLSPWDELTLFFMAVCFFAVIGVAVIFVVSSFITFYLLRKLSAIVTKVSGWVLEKVALVLLIFLCITATLFGGYCWLRGGATGLVSELEKWHNVVGWKAP